MDMSRHQIRQGSHGEGWLVSGGTGKLVWRRGYQNHQHTETGKDGHALGKAAHRKTSTLNPRCRQETHGCKVVSSSVGEFAGLIDLRHRIARPRRTMLIPS